MGRRCSPSPAATQYTSTRILAAEQRLLAAADQIDGRALAPGRGRPRPGRGRSRRHRAGRRAGGRWCGPWPPTAAGCSWSSPRPGPARPPPSRCWPTLGPPAAATSSASPPPPPPRPSSPKPPASRPTPWPGSPGPSTTSQPLPDWADRIGPKTLLLIDEAGMADTLTLDTAIGHVLEQGGRVCLVGDDRQLGAIGAGGILTDLERAHGAVRLTQLHRFTDPDEAAATLQVRDGRPRRRRLLHRPGPDQDRRPRPACPTGCSPPGSTTRTMASTR